MNDRDSKQSVRYTTTGNINLSGLVVQGGGDWATNLTSGSRVLVKAQSSGQNNGIYSANAGVWTRAADADATSEISSGMLVTVEEGTTLADTVWELITDAPITIGTTVLTFELTAALNATQVDAEAGTNNTRRMTALRVFQALRSTAANATEILRGVLRVGTQGEVDAGTLDNVVVTPKKLRAGFAVSLSVNGYLALPSWLGGIIIQWGLPTSASSVIDQTFVLAFPSACLFAFASDQGTTGPVYSSWDATNTSKTSARFVFNIAPSGYSYFAIGY